MVMEDVEGWSRRRAWWLAPVRLAVNRFKLLKKQIKCGYPGKVSTFMASEVVVLQQLTTTLLI